MKKQALAIAIASALAAPSAFAAQDTSGMHYTSASEGFYASLRSQLDFANSKGDDESDAVFGWGSSRIGIRGTNDLGGGLEGFYQWEAQISFSGSDAVDNARLGHVGLRGNFGQVVVGQFWANDYNWTHGSTDVANWNSGALSYDAARGARTGRSIEYTTPDLNGFQGAIRGTMGNHRSQPNMGNAGNGVPPSVSQVADGNDLDNWNLAAKYEVQGFTVGASYNVEADGLTHADVPGAVARTNPTENLSEDLTSWTVRLGYAQDNWYVNGWYGEDALSDAKGLNTAPTGTGTAVSAKDKELFSLAGGIAIDRVNLYAVYEKETTGSSAQTDQEDTYGTVGVQYNLGAQSRVWIEYFSRDLDTDTDKEDIVNVGLRHDF